MAQCVLLQAWRVLGFTYWMVIKKPLVMSQPETGKLIRELWLLTGMTREQFAASLAVTYSTAKRWENGHAQPSPLAMEKIASQLQRLGDRGKDLLQRDTLE